MYYDVKRNGQHYGRYSLAELQRHLAAGDIDTGDLARREGQDQWLPIEQIVRRASTVADVCTSEENVQRTPVISGVPLPPKLHWALVGLLSVVTLGLFGVAWMFVEAAYANNLRTKSTPLLFYCLGVLLTFVSGILGAFPDLKGFSVLVQLAGSVLLIIGHFSLKNALEDYYNRVERISLQLSGVMVFFFNVFYFQYHLSKIRKWKETGIYSGGLGSFRDFEPRKGVIYTQSELEAIRATRPPA
jgi:hypothetical protein